MEALACCDLLQAPETLIYFIDETNCESLLNFLELFNRVLKAIYHSSSLLNSHMEKWEEVPKRAQKASDKSKIILKTKVHLLAADICLLHNQLPNTSHEQLLEVGWFAAVEHDVALNACRAFIKWQQSGYSQIHSPFTHYRSSV
ncbi:hypothetical protein KIN20_013059 [Parelaphostrongylus tenuis]|uniref:Uncharacterized protein n=1 Tax=Parelaphostrongylus tenuis TaxID=148309 RepID=A0AAD5MCZ4_PARTN|nr:hypothetical protein KIN20_013059 [Parelaphostrongylus tenuis]